MSDEVKGYRDIMYRMSSQLSKEEGQDIAILYELDEMCRDERQFIVLVQLERRQMISESRPEKLVEVFRRIGRIDLAKETEKLSASLNKKKKKQRLVTPSAEKPPDWLMMARMQAEQLALLLEKLQSDDPTDQEISGALGMMKNVDRHLLKAEKRRGLSSGRSYVSSLHCSSADEDSLNSSLSSDNGLGK